MRASLSTVPSFISERLADFVDKAQDSGAIWLIPICKEPYVLQSTQYLSSNSCNRVSDCARTLLFAVPLESVEMFSLLF